MSKNVLISLLTLLVLIVISVGSIFSAKFTAHDFETSVKSSTKNMENIWGQMARQLKLAGFATKDYGDTFIKVVEAQASRYKNNPQAMMLWVKEQGGQMSPVMHEKFVDIVERSIARKAAVQTTKISISDQYEKFLGNSVKGMIASTIWSYPTAEVKKMMETVVSDKDTKESIKTGIEKEVVNPFKG